MGSERIYSWLMVLIRLHRRAHRSDALRGGTIRATVCTMAKSFRWAEPPIWPRCEN